MPSAAHATEEEAKAGCRSILEEFLPDKLYQIGHTRVRERVGRGRGGGGNTWGKGEIEGWNEDVCKGHTRVRERVRAKEERRGKVRVGRQGKEEEEGLGDGSGRRPEGMFLFSLCVCVLSIDESCRLRMVL